MYSHQALALARVVKASELVMTQREIPVAPCHIGPEALEHISQRGHLCFKLVWLEQAALAQHPAGLTEW